MKIVKAVAPYYYPGFLNFKTDAYEAWVRCGGQIAKSHYPWRIFHGLASHCDIPRLWKNEKIAKLRFVSGYSFLFDTFPDTLLYEVIPVVWDCWPCHFEKMCTWLKKHDVRTAVFTSSQVADFVKDRFPLMNILAITEGLDDKGYYFNGPLKYRSIDVLEYGREIDNVVKYNLPDTVKYVHGKVNGKNIFSQQQLFDALANSKIVLTFPKSMTNPEESGGIETLTLRYWEAMFSGALLVGHAPQELVNLLGYNPVIEVDFDKYNTQILEILNYVEKFQAFADKNKENALIYGKWSYSIKKIRKFLVECGYKV